MENKQFSSNKLEELKPQEREFFNKVAEDYNKLKPTLNLQVFHILANTKRCPMCKFKIDGIIKNNPKEIRPIELNVKFLVHYFQTHGIPPASTVDTIAEKLFIDNELKRDFIEKYKFLDKY